MEYYLRYGQTFPVPSAVAENLLKLASHDQLKVLLYVLCHAEAPLPSAQIEQACGVSADAAEEALAFWQSVNILHTSEQMPAVSILPAAQQQPVTVPAAPERPAAPEPQAAPAASAEPPAPVQNSGAVQMTSSSFSLLPSQVADRIRENRIIAEMFRMIEQIAGKPLNHTEQKSLIWMHEYLGLQPDVILMLAAFCAEHDAFNVRYMEKIALEWQERGVTTHALVQEDIQRRSAAKTYTGQIMRVLEMNRRPTEKQQVLIDSWCRHNISPEMIRIASEKTREKKDDKLDFKYLNGIVENWVKNGISTPEQAKAQDEAFYAAKQKPQTGSSAGSQTEPENTSFDLSDFDQLVNRF